MVRKIAMAFVPKDGTGLIPYGSEVYNVLFHVPLAFWFVLT